MANKTDHAYIAGLVIRSQRDDSDAFAELYAQTYNKVYNYACHYLRDIHMAQDAVQEVYILALKNIHKINDPTLFIAWLNQISFRVCYDMTKKNGPFASSPDPEILELICDDNPDYNPEESHLIKEEYIRLDEAIQLLPPLEQQVITMRYFNNMIIDDIANAMDISRSTVKRYLASAQETLRNKLKE